MLVQPLLQLRAALCQSGGHCRGLAHALRASICSMHGHQYLLVIHNIPGDRVDLCIAEIQGRSNLVPGPPGFEVVQDVPDGDSCSLTRPDRKIIWVEGPLKSQGSSR